MKWFGIALVDPDEKRIKTPVGQPCGFCQEPIVAGDRGCMIPHVGDGPTHDVPYHFECNMRLVIGPLAHQQRRCSCFGGTEHDPPGMTLREAAQAAYRYWLDHHQEPTC